MTKINCPSHLRTRAAPAVFAIAVGLALAGCATRPASVENNARPLVLERDFQGRSYAAGAFKNSITGLRRDFKVTLDGASQGGAFVLTERFAYADGEKGVKTWRFQSLGDGRYRGTREDVVGFAEIARDGNAIRLSYDVDLPGESGPTRVHFEDILLRTADGKVLNNAVVSKFGVPVGVVDLRFSRNPL
jgi:hypothetical protein